MNRERTIRRALLLIDGGASLEFALGDAYNAGHVAGSGVRSLTEAEKDLAEGARKLGEYQVQTLAVHCDGAFADLIDAVRNEGEEKTEPSIQAHSLPGLSGLCGPGLSLADDDSEAKADWRHGRD